MNDALDNLVSLLTLERLNDTSFQGRSLDIGTNRVYGGQVLGQSLKAAQMTVDSSKKIHSMHAYFLRMGNHKMPINYKVDITRDGKSFATRRVAALQQDEPIFITATSFQIEETGLQFQHVMPEVAGPDDLNSIMEFDQRGRRHLPEALHQLLKLSAPFIIKPVDNYPVETGAYQRHFWVKTTRPLPDDPDLHRAILAYISDYGLVTATLIPHGLDFGDPAIQLASIDHAMWFHRPFRVDEWVLYSCEAIATSNARGLAKGSMYNKDGTLIASTIQEGLLRHRKKDN